MATGILVHLDLAKYFWIRLLDPHVIRMAASRTTVHRLGERRRKGPLETNENQTIVSDTQLAHCFAIFGIDEVPAVHTEAQNADRDFLRLQKLILELLDGSFLEQLEPHAVSVIHWRIVRQVELDTEHLASDNIHNDLLGQADGRSPEPGVRGSLGRTWVRLSEQGLMPGLVGVYRLSDHRREGPLEAENDHTMMMDTECLQCVGSVVSDEVPAAHTETQEANGDLLIQQNLVLEILDSGTLGKLYLQEVQVIHRRIGRQAELVTEHFSTNNKHNNLIARGSGSWADWSTIVCPLRPA